MHPVPVAGEAEVQDGRPGDARPWRASGAEQAACRHRPVRVEDALELLVEVLDGAAPFFVEDAADVDAVVNFAAETHVDRSIAEPDAFITTHALGTFVLLEAARERGVRYVQVSTDEVYGSIEDGSFTERSPLDPSSPYSATKAGGDLLVSAHAHTHGIEAVICRGSNNYGPRQYPEKLIPLCVLNALHGDPLPVYGDGRQVRNWLYVEDFCRAIHTVLLRGLPGEAYNVGGPDECENLHVVKRILDLTGRDESLIEHVRDRPGTPPSATRLGNLHPTRRARTVAPREQVGSQLSQIIVQVQQMAPRCEAASEGMRAQATGAEQITQALAQLGDSGIRHLSLSGSRTQASQTPPSSFFPPYGQTRSFLGLFHSLAVPRPGSSRRWISRTSAPSSTPGGQAARPNSVR